MSSEQGRDNALLYAQACNQNIRSPGVCQQTAAFLFSVKPSIRTTRTFASDIMRLGKNKSPNTIKHGARTHTEGTALASRTICGH